MSQSVILRKEDRRLILRTTVRDLPSGEPNTASNLGAGEGVFAQKNGTDLEFKSLTEGTDIGLTATASEIEIAYTGTPGETNDGQSLGAGQAVFAGKSGTDLQFKSLTAGTSISLTPSATEIQIAYTGTPFSDPYTPPTGQFTVNGKISGKVPGGTFCEEIGDNATTGIGTERLAIGANSSVIGDKGTSVGSPNQADLRSFSGGSGCKAGRECISLGNDSDNSGFVNCFNSGRASIPSRNNQATFGTIVSPQDLRLFGKLETVVANESPTATAGAGAATPATTSGFIIIRTSVGLKKIAIFDP